MSQSSSKLADSKLLAAMELHKHYRMGSEDLHVLRGVDLSVERGEWVAILGASGSGKSTLLHLLGALDRPSKGKVLFDGRNVYGLRGAVLDNYRNRHVGFVFQFYHLLPEFTAVENVLLGATIGESAVSWVGRGSGYHQRASALLGSLGLGDRLTHRPSKLSGGERQRVAIARALINQPDLLLADEPTGNLDAETGDQILQVFQNFHQRGQTIIMVTHDQRVARLADRVLTLRRGELAKDATTLATSG